MSYSNSATATIEARFGLIDKLSWINFLIDFIFTKWTVILLGGKKRQLCLNGYFTFLTAYTIRGDPKSFIEFYSTNVFLKKCYLIKMTTILNHFYVVWIVSLQFHTNNLKPNYKQTTNLLLLQTWTLKWVLLFHFYLNLGFLGIIKFNVQQKQKNKKKTAWVEAIFKWNLPSKSLCFTALSDSRYRVLVMVNFVLFFMKWYI